MENTIQLLKIKTLQNQFDGEFHKRWLEFITGCDSKMSRAKQLNIGNHTRPFLVYLGSTVNTNFDDQALIKQTAQISVSIEAIHKASVIIDDIIDGDSLRRGIPCMHSEFGEYETVFFAVCMLARGMDNINQILFSEERHTIHKSVISILCDTIYSMCHGAIMEITSGVDSQTNLKYIQEIIDSETIKLIENSLYVGFLYTEPANEALGTAIRKIGKKCGYIFQVMNDLEAFCNPKHTLAYKGNINSDFLRSRKNIILPYLYDVCSWKDKKQLVSLLGGDELSFQAAKELFDKYNIAETIMRDINEVYDSIFAELVSAKPKMLNQHWHDLFMAYLKYTKSQYQSVLNIV